MIPDNRSGLEGAAAREKIIIDALKKKGSRITNQRREIIRILAGDPSHPTTGSILEKVREKIPDISSSTVYYTLNLLKRERLIKELEFYELENRYETEMSDHIDLVCTRCGAIVNFFDGLPPTREAIEDATGFRSARTRLEYYGLCKACREEG